MNTITIILLILFLGAVFTYFIDSINRKWTGISAFIFTLSALFYYVISAEISTFTTINIGSIKLQWHLSDFSNYFIYIVLGLGMLSTLYAIKYMEGKARLGYYFSATLLTILGMFGVVISRDFISLFIFWEIMTWASFLLIIYNAFYKVKTKGIKYMIFSAIGAYAMLTAIVFIYQYYGTFNIMQAINKGAFDFKEHIFIPVLLLLGFGIKTAIMPFHVWAPSAYAKSPMSFTSLFSGAMSKMGVFGIILVFIAYYSKNSEAFLIPQLFAWMGGITAVMATIYALIQTDAKKLLAYSSVAQLGYIVIALSVGSKLGVMSALFLTIMHAVFKGALFMVAGAVERQAGTTDMTKVSGLIRKMPYTFFVALVSIIALAGVPPLGGFVGKWMLYEALITESNNYILVIVVFFSSTAAFLYAYRFLFGLFLGQEEKETENVKEAPVTMLIPMILLALIAIVLGTLPGIIIKPISLVMNDVGFLNVSWKMSSLSNVWNNTTDLSLIGLLITAVFIIAMAYLTFKGRKNTKFVGTKDISSSGELWKEGENWTFQQDFYKPFERAASPLYKFDMNKIWKDLGASFEAFFNFFRKIYTGNGQTYAIYVVGFLALLLLFKDYIFN